MHLSGTDPYGPFIKIIGAFFLGRSFSHRPRYAKALRGGEVCEVDGDDRRNEEILSKAITSIKKNLSPAGNGKSPLLPT
jgi:hypothetical protein